MGAYEPVEEKRDKIQEARLIEHMIETQSILDGNLPEFMFAIKRVAGTGLDVEQKLFDYLSSIESDTNSWGLIAFSTVAAYKPDAAIRYIEELLRIRKVASEKDAALCGRNFWEYRLSYNPLRLIISRLEFLDSL